MQTPRALLLLLLLASPAAADRLVPRSGPAVHGVIVSETEDEVVFNPNWSRNPAMTYEVLHLPRGQIKKLETEPRPQVEVWRRVQAAGDDATALAQAARVAEEAKLKHHAHMCWCLALAADPELEEAEDAVGGATKWQKIRKGRLELDGDLRAALATYIDLEDVGERRVAAEALFEAGLDLEPAELERYHRSRIQPKGLQVDRPLAWGADRFPGAVYTLYVPSGYSPVLPVPLLIGLHGGGPDGKAGDEVVGSGESAMNFYRRQAERHGVIVACPDALAAPWSAEPNEEMVRALIEELKGLYNIDVDRISMTGHSMGGFGTWSLGPRLAEDLAVISPMAGAGRGGVSRLVETKTPVFIYHSDDDFIDVAPDRAAARALRDADADFVYTELSGEGHGFPDSIQAELFEFLLPRRRYERRRKDVWPRSSFAGKVTKDEERYLGDPLLDWEGEVEGLDAWIDQLRVGGARAAAAARRIAEARPDGATDDVCKVLSDRRASPDVQAWAAHTLGLLADPEAARALRRSLGGEASRERARLAREAAAALGALADADAASSFEKATETWTAFYESKETGGTLAFSDWTRAVPTLAAVVRGWTAAEEAGDTAVLRRTAVRRVLAPGHEVRTSERVPQDPSIARADLAGAVAHAYARWGAADELWTELLAAVEGDARSMRAVESAR